MIGPATFSIQAASRMTGLSPERLRVWERRYGTVVPQRAPNGRRLYSRDDVERLRLLKTAVDVGHPIGNVCALLPADLRALAPPPSRPQAPSIRLDGSIGERLDHLAATLPPREFVLQVAAPLQGRPITGPAASQICGTLLRTLRRPGPPDLLVAGDLLLAAALAAAHGRRLLYLGSGLAPARVARYALEGAIGTALVEAEESAEVDALLDELPLQVELWVMGPAAHDVPPQVTPIFDLEELDRELA